MKITFINYNQDMNLYQGDPISTIKSLPEWYKKFPKYNEEDSTNELTDSTLKNCVPFFDAMSSGYVFTTPCDIEFTEINNIPQAVIKEEKFNKFVGSRGPMQYFTPMDAYHDYHFHWVPDWATVLPDGYSALFISPINRYELPFLTTSGIIDSDKSHVNGLIPFFIKRGFSGVVPKGTPYVQIIPFKREIWESETKVLNNDEVYRMYQSSVEKYRKVRANGYRNTDWTRKYYE